MPRFFSSRGGEKGSHGAPVPEPTRVLDNTSFRIRAGNVSVEIFYGDPKRPASFSGEMSLIQLTDIMGHIQSDGTVSGVLDSDIRRRAAAAGNDKEVAREDYILVSEFVGSQPDLQKLLIANSVRQGSPVKAVITAPAAAVLPQRVS